MCDECDDKIVPVFFCDDPFKHSPNVILVSLKA